ncbi:MULTISPECIES: DUF6716 putative glycosyltransferase [Paeniglutamicibacter]|uniref:Glycosyltransferase family 4 protein n=1 Tax=Paeniglutamicibacter sulfureus TaxID=43666 RepID=A0ABU2BJP0_9MICC|nr:MULTISPECIES: DUF6716 putative glycosyltransferase [Paeniglutamicibacter]MCV9995802.1 hypothetical protein [Paeniglutamicibacter sp. ZC-3]MDO2934266.1 hypothetical protein [Paeniglutamicibacter sulfureus]MDR7358451.1 hypothetical protein [Paeniglutamicibacter sulfureus]
MNNLSFRPSIVAVADSDSYLKLACTTLSALGPEWDRRVVLVRTPIAPTPEQIAAATAGTCFEAEDIPVIPRAALNYDSLEEHIIFAAATGPVVSELFTKLLRSKTNSARPAALISALPGVAYPATTKGWAYRRSGDAFIVHSHAEAREFSHLADMETGHSPDILVSKLPFLKTAGFPQPQTSPIDTVVFASQAKVPVQRAEREEILLALERVARLNPDVRVLVKLRARAGEPQTHAEAHPFDALWEQLVAEGKVGAGHVEFVTGAMDRVLVPGSALLTVSSTAALEAVDRGLPVLVMTDFGLNDQMLNSVFRGSGLLGTLDDAATLHFSFPNRAWLRENYFHRRGPEFISALSHYAQRAQNQALTTSNEQLAMVRDVAFRQRVRTSLPRPALEALLRIRRWWLRERGSRI